MYIHCVVHIKQKYAFSYTQRYAVGYMQKHYAFSYTCAPAWIAADCLIVAQPTTWQCQQYTAILDQGV